MASAPAIITPEDIGGIPETEKGIAGGVATLDPAARLPVAQLPVDAMNWKEVWDASLNSPALADGIGDPGDLYKVSVAGTVDFGNGPISFLVGDGVIYSSNGRYQKSPGGGSVIQVNGQMGDVVLDQDDIGDGTNFKQLAASEKLALAGTNGTPSGSNKFLTNSDPRNSDSRTPTQHSSSHATGGGDPLTPSDIGALAASEKAAANGVAPLGADSKVPAAYLPAYVDDVLEYVDLASFPVTGETGKIYVDLSTNRTYRWSGSVYVEISASPGTTDSVVEGAINKYYTNQRVRDYVKSVVSVREVHVSQDTGNDSTGDGSLLAPYATIQAGINAANLIAAYYRQCKVKVFPPSGNGYVENLSFTQQGVILESISPVYRTNILVRGNVTINLTGSAGGANYIAASNEIYIHGFTFFNGGSGHTFTFSGSIFQRLWISQCYVDTTGASNSALVMTNTGVSGGGIKSTIDSRDTDWNNSSATNPTIRLSAGRFFIKGAGPDIQNGNSAGSSVTVDGASATACSFTSNNVNFAGQIVVSDNLSTFTLGNFVVASGTLPCVVTPSSPSTGFISIGAGGFTSTNTNTISGSGIVALGANNAKLSTSGDIAATVTVILFPQLPQGATIFGNGTQTTNALATIKNGHLDFQQTTAPTAALGAAGQIGTGSPSVTLSNASDQGGKVSLTTGASGALTAGVLFTITFNKAFANTPNVVVVARNAAGSAIQLYVTQESTTIFKVASNVALANGTNYLFSYIVLGA